MKLDINDYRVTLIPEVVEDVGYVKGVLLLKENQEAIIRLRKGAGSLLHISELSIVSIE